MTPTRLADALTGTPGYDAPGLYWRDADGGVLTLVLGYDAADATARAPRGCCSASSARPASSSTWSPRPPASSRRR